MFSDPKKNIVEMNIGEGMSVVDFGSGVGFYTFPLAERVGEYGKVFAVDVMVDHLTKIHREADRRNFKNISVIHADLETPKGSGLPDASVDRVVITNVLFQVDDPKQIAVEAKRIIKKNGRVAVVEWVESFGMMGPHPDHVMSEKETINTFAEEGLVVDKKFDAGSHHYGLLFKHAVKGI
ncbi:MAG: methyltransferase domain-containing protein [Patescibacteria group bacterium]